MQLNFVTLQRLLDCENPVELTKRVDALVGDFGASNWIYAFEEPAPSTKRHWLGDYPKAWVEHYQAMGYPDVDPTVLHAVQHGTPYLWPNYQKLPHDPSSLLLPANKIFLEAHDFHLDGGITIPLHHGVKWGLLSVAFHSFRSSVEASARMAELFFFAHNVHEVALKLLVEPISYDDLTKTEIECLQRAAIGWSTPQIAESMGRKTRWVTDVFRDIFKKLGVENRQAAIAVALTRKLVAI